MITIVVPVYNSEQTLPVLVGRTKEVLERLNEDYEIILVNDGSRDRSDRIIRQLCKQNKAVRGIELESNFGQQNALLCGLRHGCGDYYVTMDDDLQYQPEDIPCLLAALKRQAYDVVYGIPSVKRHGPYRNLGTKMTNLLFTLMFQKPWSKRVSSFRVMTKALVKQIAPGQSARVYLSAATLRQTLRIGNCPVSHMPRYKGKSNYNLKKLLVLYVNIFIYYSNISVFRHMRRKQEQYIVKEVI